MTLTESGLRLAIPTRALSPEDWLGLDVEDELGKRIELVGGGLIIMAPPIVGHAVVVSQLSAWLLKAGYSADLILAGVGLITDAATARIPDLVLLREPPGPDARALSADLVRLVIEVVSPSTAAQDRHVKPGEYAAVGIDWYWRVEGAAIAGGATVFRTHRLRGPILPPLALRDLLTQDPAALLRA